MMFARIAKFLLLAVVFLGGAQSATTQEDLPFPFTVEGEWWMSMAGNRGMMRIDFDSIAFGASVVSGAGISTDFESVFTIADDDSGLPLTQSLFFTSNRQIVSDPNGPGLVLLDADGTSQVGTLVVTGGTLSGTKNNLKLDTRLTLNGGAPKRVRMKGVRIPDSTPDLQGRSTDFRVRGTRVKSNKYDLSLVDNGSLGFPFLDLISGGPVRVDGQEIPGALVTGIAGVDSRGRIYSEVMTFPTSNVDLGDGFGRGRIIPPTVEGLRPTLSLKSRTDQRKRLSFRGTLLEIVN